MKEKELHPLNEKTQLHGFWEKYFESGKLAYKGLYINGVMHGPWFDTWQNEKPAHSGTYNYGKRIGMWDDYSYDGRYHKKTYYI